jgi:transcription initiation factor IIE alpha subunit
MSERQYPTWEQLLEYIQEKVYDNPIRWGSPPRPRTRGMDNVLRAIWHQGFGATRRQTVMLTGYRKTTVRNMVYLLHRVGAIKISSTRRNRHYTLNWKPKDA